MTNQIGGVDGQITIHNFYKVHFAVASAHYCHAQFAVQKKIASRFLKLSLVMAFELFACCYYLILCSCWFCASIISALKNSAPPNAEFADQFLESCASIVLALKKSAQHAQKCTD